MKKHSERLFSDLLDFVVRHNKTTLILFISICLFSAANLTKLNFELRIFDIFDKHFPSTITYHKVKDHFDFPNVVSFTFRSKLNQPLRKTDLCKIDLLFREESRTNQEVTSITHAFLLVQPVFESPKLRYPELIQLDCHQPAGTVTFESLQNTPWSVGFTDKTYRDFTVMVGFRDTIGPHRFGRFNPKVINELWTRMQREWLPSLNNIELIVGGPSAFQMHNQNFLKVDSQLNLLFLIILVLGCRILYGTWKSGILLITTLVLTLFIVLGFMAWTGCPIDLLSNSIFAMICISSIEDFIFLANELRKNPKETPFTSIRKLITPCFFTSLTTMIGFGSLIVADTPIIKRFGVWGAFGTFLEWFILFLILPAFLKLFPQIQWVEANPNMSLTWMDRLSKLTLPKWILRFSGAIFVVALLLIPKLNFNDEPTKNFGPNHPHSLNYRYLETSKGWEGVIQIYLKQVQNREHLESLMHQIRQLANIHSIISPYEHWNYLTAKVPNFIVPLVHRELKSFDYYKSIWNFEDEGLAQVYLRRTDTKTLDSTITQIKTICNADCEPVGELVVYSEYSEKVIRALFESIFTALVIVVLIIFLLSHELPLTSQWRLLYSVVWAPVVGLGVLSLSQLPINFMTCIFGPILIGLAGDNAIQFLWGSQQASLREGIVSRGSASIQLALISILMALVLLGYTMIPMRILGSIMALGFTLNLLGDLFLLHSLIKEN